MIPLFPQQLPQPTVPIVAQAGVATHPFLYLIRALFNRTGGNSGIPFTVGQQLIAAGTMQANALALSNDFNEITSGSGGVTLSNLQPGQFQFVFNGLGTALSVYPFGIGQIDLLAVSAPYVLAAGKTQIFPCYEQLPSGAPFYRSTQLG